MADLLDLLGARRPARLAEQGVLMQLNLAADILSNTLEHRLYREAVVAARLLREGPLVSRTWQLAIVASPATWTFIERQPDTQGLWDAHVPLNVTLARQLLERQRQRTLEPGAKWVMRMQPANVHWVWKAATFLLTPFHETLYMDADILVLRPSFVSDLLERSLRVADLVSPVDPNRPGRKSVRSRTGKFHINPPMYGRGIPPMCMGLLAYRLTPAVRRLIERATARLMGQSFLEDPTDRTKRIRQSDQEMIWAELMYGPVDHDLRVMPLPEEYYCPMIKIQGAVNRWSSAPTWKTSWTIGNPSREYPCHAIHGHFSDSKLTVANLSRLLPAFG